MEENEKMSLFRHYVLNTSLHGYRYIAEKGRNWTESCHDDDAMINFGRWRPDYYHDIKINLICQIISKKKNMFYRIFWTICCLLSWIATGLLILSAWYDFQNNAVSFVVDTNYLDWDTKFPSITLCETDNQKRIADFTDRTFGDPHDYNLDEIIKEQTFFRGVSFYTMQLCGPGAQTANQFCFIKNFSAISEKVRSNCKQILKICKWNQEEFDCCTYFRIIDTEMGKCYGINSIQTREPNVPFYKMVSNKKTGPGTLYLEIFGLANVYILGEEEVPSMTTLLSDTLEILPHIRYHRQFAIKEIENQAEVCK
ncbi:hypothetical protein NQ317_016869 [Molorchus minor]|uniref:Sodium channel protein Nach n=1 Tax=Molorchus minor TaxID=1323400 RepID=A0ABQ9J0V6_9CUCU|nr:hypothetical protein NQ317_016869 [Molorchus minor]